MLFDDSIDLLEDDVVQYEKKLLDILLIDRTSRKNIIWATDDYCNLGERFGKTNEILPNQITEKYSMLIQPRSSKSKNEQIMRTKDKAEVFTPCWVCNKQNNMVDEQWFGRKSIFNIETNFSWIINEDKIIFDEDGQYTWMKYVDNKRLEITCGEAPYLVSRYDTVTGESIPIERRIGLLDRKLRVVNENTSNEEEWLKWTFRAFQSVYGYEFQGDNLLLARENLLRTFTDYYQNRFCSFPSRENVEAIAKIISWNIWQMDGIKLVIPYSCHTDIIEQYSLFGVETTEQPCLGCKEGKIHKHNGTYCKVMDWIENNSCLFSTIMKGELL